MADINFKDVERGSNLLAERGYAPDVRFQTGINDLDFVNVEWNTMGGNASFLIEFPDQPSVADLVFIIKDPENTTSFQGYDFVVENRSAVKVFVYSQGRQFGEELAINDGINHGDIIRVGKDYYMFEIISNQVGIRYLTDDEAEVTLSNYGIEQPHSLETENLPDFVSSGNPVKWLEGDNHTLEVFLGRFDPKSSDPENKVFLQDSNNNEVSIDSGVSRTHARIIYKPAEGNFYIEDLNSTNGTYVNGKKEKIKMLKNNDVVNLGSPKQPNNYVVSIGTNGEFSFEPVAA